MNTQANQFMQRNSKERLLYSANTRQFSQAMFETCFYWKAKVPAYILKKKKALSCNEFSNKGLEGQT